MMGGMNKIIILRVLVLSVILSVPSYFIYKDYLSTTKDLEVIKTVENYGSGLIKTDEKTNEIRIVPVEDGLIPSNKATFRGKIPDLDKKWSIPESFSSDAKRIINSRIDELTEGLKADNSQYDKWIGLGTLRKLIGDYDEARNIWEFASVNWPDSFVSYHNLGDLYGGYLKDPVKAERYFLKVVELDPNYVADYMALYDLYKRQYGESGEKTGAILLSGLKNNPKSVDLMITLATHYRGLGDKDNAKKYYEMALVQAKELSNLPLQKAIEEELKKI